METRTQRDTRGTEIKRLLKALYPTAQFQVRLHKYSMGESINVYTDLLEAGQYADDIWTTENRMRVQESVTDAEYQAYQAYKAMLLKNTETTRRLRADLSGYERVDRDERGEILSGGNTYLHISRLAPKLVLTHDATNGATVAMEAK